MQSIFRQLRRTVLMVEGMDHDITFVKCGVFCRGQSNSDLLEWCLAHSVAIILLLCSQSVFCDLQDTQHSNDALRQATAPNTGMIQS